jgi:hypothetical protein
MLIAQLWIPAPAPPPQAIYIPEHLLKVWDNNEGAIGFYRSMGYGPREHVLWKTL